MDPKFYVRDKETKEEIIFHHVDELLKARRKGKVTLYGHEILRTHADGTQEWVLAAVIFAS
jgi:hypothetical protein